MKPSTPAQRARRTPDEVGEYAQRRNPKDYTEADIPRLHKEARTEKPRRRKYGLTGDRRHRHKRLDLLVAGDKDLLTLGAYKGGRIVTSSEYLRAR